MIEKSGMSDEMKKLGIAVLTNGSRESLKDTLEKITEIKIQDEDRKKAFDFFKQNYCWSIMEDRLANIYKKAESIS